MQRLEGGGGGRKTIGLRTTHQPYFLDFVLKVTWSTPTVTDFVRSCLGSLRVGFPAEPTTFPHLSYHSTLYFAFLTSLFLYFCLRKISASLLRCVCSLFLSSCLSILSSIYVSLVVSSLRTLQRSKIPATFIPIAMEHLHPRRMYRDNPEHHLRPCSAWWAIVLYHLSLHLYLVRYFLFVYIIQDPPPECVNV